MLLFHGGLAQALARSRILRRIEAEFGMKVMSRLTPHVHLIYLRPDGMLLSKKHYSDWREIQDEYESYMTSLGPFSQEGLLDFLSEQYGCDDANWGFSREEVRDFIESDATVLEARQGNT